MEEMDGITLYRGNLKNRLETFCELLKIQFEEIDWSGIIGTQGLVLDCSGGAATSWFSDGLSRRGLNCIEVSSLLDPINKNCGAGGLSPTDSWSLEELQLNHREHRLLWTLGQRLQENDGVPPWSEGEIVGAALDGDGDRCLLIEATEHGLKVVDGDLICDDILRATSMIDGRAWKVAASIESDLGFSANLQRLNQQHESITTAVGDRWLSVALSPLEILHCEQFPAVIGTEDSGHLVMPVPVPNEDRLWGMVGDGAATLLLALLSRVKLRDGTGPKSFEQGWKKRIAIQPSNRSLWTGDNLLADLMQDTAESWCKSPLQRISIEGEPALLFLSGTLQEKPISIAIRNSGTEAKTAISVRFSSGIERDGGELIEILVDTLRPHLKP
jgi:phosphomannomutase